jgi:hypothetical protein
MFCMNESAPQQIRAAARLSVVDPGPRAARQRGEPIDSIAAAAPVRELLLVEALGYARVPTVGNRPVYHRARQGQWVASVLRDNPGYRLERWSGGDGDR